MINFKDLLIENKIDVIRYISEHICLVRKEETHLTIPVQLDDDGNLEVEEAEAEYVFTKESIRFGYYCDQCQKYILGNTTEDLIEHTIKDLGL
jgi:hypothetical protein